MVSTIVPPFNNIARETEQDIQYIHILLYYVTRIHTVLVNACIHYVFIQYNMDSIDLSGKPKYAAIFKGVNFFIAFVCIFLGATELFTRFDYFFQGILILFIGLLIGYLEVNIPPKLYTYASSFFSFLGRGAIYILISILNLHGTFERYVAAMIIMVIGFVYVGLEFTGIEPPENMQGEAGWNGDVLDDVI
jgi:hypothetical protein